MNPQEQLASFITQSRAAGKVNDVIKRELVTAGWQEDMVIAALASEISPVPPPPPIVSAGPEYAGFWNRVAASLLDGMILSLLAILLSAPVLALSFFGIFTSEPVVVIVLYILQFAMAFAYYPYMESIKGATFGKRFIGITVVKEETGQFLSLGRSLGRTSAKLLSAIIFGIGFLMAAFTKKKQGLHDKMVGAVVLRTPRVNKYRTILTIILGIFGPFLFMLLVVPLLMTFIVGAMFAGALGGATFDPAPFEETSDFNNDEYWLEQSVIELTASELDEIISTSSIVAMIEARPELFAEGYALAGPTIVAWSPDYYSTIVVYTEDFFDLWEDTHIKVDIKEVIDDTGANVYAPELEDGLTDVWPKSYQAGDSFLFAQEIRKRLFIAESADEKNIQRVSGSVRFSVPLEGGEQYERSFDFTLPYQAPVE